MGGGGGGGLRAEEAIGGKDLALIHHILSATSPSLLSPWTCASKIAGPGPRKSLQGRRLTGAH